MTYRPHQLRMIALCDEILSGAPIEEIIAAVTPGGGKSKLPVILADKLIPRFADKLVWVAPRNNLKYQGEQEFLDPRFPTTRRLRAADGNENDPCRGTDGYLTTYQAVGLSPEVHAQFCREHRTILFLDEEHHVSDDGRWAPAIQAMREAAVLVVGASGTLARGDGQKIHGLDYKGAFVDLTETASRRIIRYGRAEALRDGAILPIFFDHLDGRAEWEDEQGERRSAGTLAGGDYASAALFTALRTGYAKDLLDKAAAHWQEHRQTYPKAKMLVVAPSIEFAAMYRDHLHRRGSESLIATSEDNNAARVAIDRFKGETLPTADVLVTCQMAYEGMSVPEISHVACLTHIRSIPWLEQCFARANRRAPGKVAGFIFGPADARFRDAIASIEAEQIQALRDAPEAQGEASAGDTEGGEGGGFGRPGIRPIGSAAYREEGPELFTEPEAPRPDGGMTPREAERLLRKQIHEHLEAFLAGTRPGSKAVYTRLVYRALKDAVGGKAREDCTIEELTTQWALLKERFPVGGRK
ncbi:MAG: DEAD/DEAH box helicase family protein [Spirochaetaceae bacterium]|nr:DEAD/DEAH box helicase family protein [Spirochaetaceae bacterium]